MSDTNYDRQDRDRLDQNTEEDKEQDLQDAEKYEQEAKELIQRRNEDDD